MTKTTCLILDRSDFTKDGNLKAEAFDAFCQHPVVLHGDRVLKNPHAVIQAPEKNPEPETETPEDIILEEVDFKTPAH